MAPKSFRNRRRRRNLQKPIPKKQPSIQPNWLELPHDVTSKILLKLGAIEILETAQRVCTAWHKLCNQPSMWRSIDMSNDGDPDSPYDLEKMTRRAVDLSCGQLEDIYMEYFCTRELLDYISRRSPHLRRLGLASCYDVGDEALVEAAKRLLHLEELEMYLNSFDTGTIDAIGSLCPQLKTFKYNIQGDRRMNMLDFDDEDDYNIDEDALAIAKSMSELHHLHLMGNTLSNVGLKAILKGCPHLISLDLRKCFYLNLKEENLEKICLERIKNVWLPEDSTKGYRFPTEVDDYDDESYESDQPTSDFSYDFEDRHHGHFYDFMSDEDYDDFTDVTRYFDF